MKKIPLTQDKFAIVDNEDFEYLNQWKWLYDNGYATRRLYLGGGRKNPKYQKVRMHRFITNCPLDRETDHIDLNGLNNQRNNLRTATHQQNMFNRKVRSDNKSGFKGVYWNSRIKRWIVDFRLKGKRMYVGLFNDLLIAAKKYDEIARKYHKEYSRGNFPILTKG